MKSLHNIMVIMKGSRTTAPEGNCPQSLKLTLTLTGGNFPLGQLSGYHYEVPNDNTQQQFVYFIVAICCNTLKSFLSQFL